MGAGDTPGVFLGTTFFRKVLGGRAGFARRPKRRAFLIFSLIVNQSDRVEVCCGI